MKAMIVMLVLLAGLTLSGCYKVVVPCGPTTTGGICVRPPVVSK